ncbi:secy-independent transporter protein, putative [Plasmodium knowlesi strain H]|uniref:Secy-independent transporter protein, putative n=1 Tax=Plasmodium knowlesi (strain H) TaxID=5851 RepID=A0A1A7W5H1_PLAKH|nr:secy-independent transporter protein, putative [Plasmodium knowlesi strain H]
MKTLTEAEQKFLTYIHTYIYICAFWEGVDTPQTSRQYVYYCTFRHFPLPCADHDWVNDKKWKLYLSNLYPSPSIHNIEKYKKKYFQKNVDKNLDVNASFGNETVKEQTPQSPNSQGHGNKGYIYSGQVPLMTFFFSTFVLCLSLFYFVLLSLNLSLYKKMATFMSLSYFCAFLSLLYADYKTQKQNFSLVQFFSSEKGQYLSYSMILFFIKDAVLIFLPIFFTLLITSYLMYKQIKPLFPLAIQRNYYINKVVSYLDQTVRYVYAHLDVAPTNCHDERFSKEDTRLRNVILLDLFSLSPISTSMNIFYFSYLPPEQILNIYLMRANIEIYNLVFIIICLFLKRASLLNLIIYLHFFKLKYSSSDSYFHACYAKNGEMIRQCLSHPMVPKAFLNVFNKMAHYFNTYLTYRRR